MKGEGCKKQIQKLGLRPNVRDHDSKKYWDGITAIRLDGEETFLSDGMAAQMRKMVKDGYWPEFLNVTKG